MALTALPYGITSEGKKAQLFLLSNAHGTTAAVTDLGACLVSVRVPDTRGQLLDVALGCAGLLGYEHNPCFLGATVGRVANRTAGARFELDGTEHFLTANERGNNLHSGPEVWNERLWRVVECGEDFVTLGLDSPAGDQGFPGEVSMLATYRLTEEDELVERLIGVADTRTPLNATNHSYWNLDGHASGSALGQRLWVDADCYLPVDDENIPTGSPAEVAGTPFDLRAPRVLSDVVEALPKGIDHNYCLHNEGHLAAVATLESPTSGVKLTLSTDAPGLQVYMGGFLDAEGKDGAHYGEFSGIALEAQRWPDSLHHEDWPSMIFGPERTFAQTISFAFSTTEI